MSAQFEQPGEVPSLVRVDDDPGKEYVITENGLIIGRQSNTDSVAPDVPLPADGVASRRHARIYLQGGACWVIDLGSKNGTSVGSERVDDKQPRRLFGGDCVRIGDHQLLVLALAPGAAERDRRSSDQPHAGQRRTDGDVPRPKTRLTALGGDLVPLPEARTIPYGGRRLTIGRAKDNDLVLDDMNVSRHHAAVEPDGAGTRLVDLDSRNGTRVDAAPVSVAPLAVGAQIGIGSYRLTFTGDELRVVSERGVTSVEAIGLTVKSGDKQILAPTYLKIRPRELVAIVGENGAGKTTLLKALAGITTPSAGAVLLNGEPVAQRSSEIGYVPQTDNIHRWLTVEEALRFGARLRLPESSRAEIRDTTNEVIDALQLGGSLRERVIGSEEEKPHAERLSGGERKRACVAMEMLSKPSVVFLDEPTSPLDPWFGQELVDVLRALARSNCSVVMVTHHHDDVPGCDKVAVMARGGYLCYYGPPRGALEFFGVGSYVEIYGALRKRTGEEWAEHAGGEVPTARATARRDLPREVATIRRRRFALLAQTRVLASRYALLLRRDRTNLTALTLSIPILAVMFLLAFNGDVFRPNSSGDEPNAPTFLFFLTFVVILLGMIVAFREIIKERAIFRRERGIGVDARAYVWSKLIVLGCIGAIQALVLGALVFASHPLLLAPGAYIGSFVALVLGTIAGICVGLLVSALVKSQEQATTYIAIPLALQLFFGGSIITLAGRGPGVNVPAALMPSRWSFAALGALARLDRIREIADPRSYGGMFGGSAVLDMAIVLGLSALVAGLTMVALARGRD